MLDFISYTALKWSKFNVFYIDSILKLHKNLNKANKNQQKFCIRKKQFFKSFLLKKRFDCLMILTERAWETLL